MFLLRLLALVWGVSSADLETLSFDLVDARPAGGHALVQLSSLLDADEQSAKPGEPSTKPGGPKARALLIAAVAPSDCAIEGPKDRCQALARVTAASREKGGQLLVLLLSDEQSQTAISARVKAAKLPILVTQDSYGVFRAMLKLQVPGSFLLIENPSGAHRFETRRFESLAADGETAAFQRDARAIAAFSRAVSEEVRF